MNQDLTIPKPPEFIFERMSAVDSILTEEKVQFLLEKIDCPISGGLRVHIKGALQPKKGFPFPEAIWRINIVKRIVVEGLRALYGSFFISVALFLILPYKMKLRHLNRFVTSFVDISERVMNPIYVKERYLTEFSRELQFWLTRFLALIEIEESMAYRAAKVVGHIFEYDDVYRYRGQDICSETTKAKLLSTPRKELIRLLEIYKSREKHQRIKDNTTHLVTILSLVLLHPKIKKAFMVSLSGVNFYNLQYDDMDRYWVAMKGDYSYFGIAFKDRKDVHFPPGYLINEQ